MDVQPPATDSPLADESSSSEDNVGPANIGLAQESDKEDEGQPAGSSETPAQDDAEVSEAGAAGLPGVGELPSFGSDSSDEQPSEQPDRPNPLAVSSAPKQPKKKSRAMAIVITALITLALAGAAVFAYMNMNNDTAEAPSGDSSETGENEVNPEEIDNLTNEIDESMQEIDDSQDFPEEELSDENLEL
jgi:hypothetical protein